MFTGNKSPSGEKEMRTLGERGRDFKYGAQRSLTKGGWHLTKDVKRVKEKPLQVPGGKYRRSRKQQKQRSC